MRSGGNSKQRRPGVLAAMLVLALMVVQFPAPSGGAATKRETFVTMMSDSADYIGHGAPRFYHPGNAEIRLTGNRYAVAVSTSGGNLGHDFGFDFAAAPEKELTVGHYEDAQRAPFREEGRPGIDIGGNGRGCNEIEGRFEIKHLEFDGNRPTSLWVVYEQHCEGAVPALFGEVRFRVPDESGPALVGPREVHWPPYDRDANAAIVPVTVVNRGRDPMKIENVGMPEDGGGAFSVNLDECSGKRLRKNKLCTVEVRFATGEGEDHTGTLVVQPQGFPAETIALRGFVFPGVTRWTMQSDPGDHVGQGREYDYTPADGTIHFDGNREVIKAGIYISGTEWWGAWFKAPEGETLTAGTTYEHVRRAPFAGQSAGLEVTGSGNGCGEIRGSFTVIEIETNQDEDVRSFDVSFEQHCEGNPPALRGRIQVRAEGD